MGQACGLRGRVGGCVLGWGEQGRMGWEGESERWYSSSTSANSQSYSSHLYMAFFSPGCGGVYITTTLRCAGSAVVCTSSRGC